VAELAEARLRQLVAQQLGVDSAQVGTDSSLVEDLAADEMDLLEIAVALEEDFGLVVSDAVLGRVRTYGDLLESFTELLRTLAYADAADLLSSGIVRVRVIRDIPDCDEGTLLRAARLTPRVIERVIEEVLWTAGVSRLELTCSGNTSDRQLARIAQRLAWLRNRGIEVSVRRLEHDADVVAQACEPAPRSVHNQGG
jgi:acyl carrier protein